MYSTPADYLKNSVDYFCVTHRSKHPIMIHFINIKNILLGFYNGKVNYIDHIGLHYKLLKDEIFVCFNYCIKHT